VDRKRERANSRKHKQTNTQKNQEKWLHRHMPSADPLSPPTPLTTTPRRPHFTSSPRRPLPPPPLPRPFTLSASAFGVSPNPPPLPAPLLSLLNPLQLPRRRRQPRSRGTRAQWGQWGVVAAGSSPQLRLRPHRVPRARRRRRCTNHSWRVSSRRRAATCR
jgi:hypothetical protein